MKYFFILILSINLFALSIDQNITKVEPLFDKMVKINYFEGNQEDIGTYFSIIGLINAAQYSEAKEVALKFYAEKNSVVNENDILSRYLSVIGLSKYYISQKEFKKSELLEEQLFKNILSMEMTPNKFFLLLEMERAFATSELNEPMLLELERFYFLNKNRMVNAPLYISKFYRLKYLFYKSNPKLVKGLKSKIIDVLNEKMVIYNKNELILIEAISYMNGLKKEEARKLLIKLYFDVKKENSNLTSNLLFADILFNLGKVFYRESQEKESLEYFNQARDIYFKAGILKEYLNVGIDIIFAKKVLQSPNLKEEIEKLKFLAAETFGKSSEEYANVLIVEAELNYGNGEYKKAILILNEAREIYIKLFGSYSKELKILDSSIRYIQIETEF